MTRIRDDLIEIVETKKIKSNRPLVIAGFAGQGLVGSIALSYIIDNLKLSEIAYVRSRLLPPATIFIDGVLRYPFRIYSNEEGTLLAIISEISPPLEGFYDISHSLMGWIEKMDVEEVVVLSGLVVRQDPDPKLIFAAAEPEVLDKLKKHRIPMLTRGLITGIAATILNECITRKLTGICLLSPTTSKPNPEASATLIDALNRIYSLGIKMAPLIEEIQLIKEKQRELAEHAKKMSDRDRIDSIYV
ncbi:MAG: proteasome assembly chaperone family protein [Candidatus Hodarchaeota archaeon]